MKASLRESLSMPGVCRLWPCVQAGDTGKDMLRKNWASGTFGTFFGLFPLPF